MKIVTIGLDKDLLKKESPVVRRQQLYAKALGPKGELHCVVFTKRGETERKYKNVFVYPTNSFSKFTFVFDAYRVAKQIIKKQNPNLIVTQDPHVTGLVGVLLKKFLSLPLCVHFHADFLDNKYWIKENVLNRFFNCLSKYVIKRADGFRVVSSKIKRSLISKKIDSKNICVVSTPIDIDFFFKSNSKEVAKFKNKFKLNDGKHALFAGRLTAQKNLKFLLGAFKEIDCTILLAGTGELEKSIKKYAKKTGLKSAKFLGALTQKELKAAYELCDVFVLPSNYEGTAKVLKEACATATPCVTTNISGSDDVIADSKSGYIVRLNDKKEFVEKINVIISDDKLAKRLGKNAKDIMRKSLSELDGIKKVTSWWKKIGEMNNKQVL